MYIRINAAPPFSPVIKGKRQMLPSPTAEPAVARTIPNLLAKPVLFCCDIISLLDYSKLVEENKQYADGADEFYAYQIPLKCT